MEVQSTKSELQDNIRDQIMQTLVSDMTQMTKLHDDMQSDMRETETERTKKKESKTEAAKIHREIEVIENCRTDKVNAKKNRKKNRQMPQNKMIQQNRRQLNKMKWQRRKEKQTEKEI